MTRLILMVLATTAASSALALERPRAPCPATEVAPGVKMRTGACPMMFLPVDPDASRAPFERPASSAEGARPAGQELPARQDALPALTVRQWEPAARP